LARGADVLVVLTGLAEMVTGDARINHDAFIDLGGTCVELPSDAPLELLVTELAGADFVVDAIFGTGLDRPVQGRLMSIIDAVNATKARTIADIERARRRQRVSARHRRPCRRPVTFEHLVGSPPTGPLAGRVHVVDLGVPDARIRSRGARGRGARPRRRRRNFIRREPSVHKHAAATSSWSRAHRTSQGSS
jgi:NAD(P)H-hydrate epimerase